MSNNITKKDLNELEKYADQLFKAVGIDVQFTKHFLERANDERNKKQITKEELIRLFREEYAKWGKKIAQLGPDAEAVMKDMKTDINVPFVLKWDSKSQELDLVSKTIMRKKGFKTPDKEFPINEEAPTVNVGSGNIAGLGVGPQGEPGRPPRTLLRRGKFAGKDTFIVPSKTFNKALMSKRDKKWWKTYIGEEDFLDIQEYASKNPNKSIILQDESTGALVYARYGKDK